MTDILLLSLLAIPVVIVLAGVAGKLASLDDPSTVTDRDSLH